MPPDPPINPLRRLPRPQRRRLRQTFQISRAPKAQGASDGELFWYITKGDVNNGMPSWKAPEKDRWQIVNFLSRSRWIEARLFLACVSPPMKQWQTAASAPPPKRPSPLPLTKKPAPFAKLRSTICPLLSPRPQQAMVLNSFRARKNAWPQVPPGFTVELYASGLNEPRLIRAAPNGDFFVAESRSAKFAFSTASPRKGSQNALKFSPRASSVPSASIFSRRVRIHNGFTSANTDSVVRFPYKNGDLKASGPSEHIADVQEATATGLATFNSRLTARKCSSPSAPLRTLMIRIQLPPKKIAPMFSNSIPTAPGCAFMPMASATAWHGRQFKTGELWCSVNERDALGDNVVPDYITHVQDGGFYGWPWWYMGGHQDPRHAGKHPELKSKVITPDVILHPHNASLEMAFYDGKQFPAEYQGDISPPSTVPGTNPFGSDMN